MNNADSQFSTSIMVDSAGLINQRDDLGVIGSRNATTPVMEIIGIYRVVNRKTAFCFLPRNLWTLGLIRRHEEPPAMHLLGL